MFMFEHQEQVEGIEKQYGIRIGCSGLFDSIFLNHFLKRIPAKEFVSELKKRIKYFEVAIKKNERETKLAESSLNRLYLRPGEKAYKRLCVGEEPDEIKQSILRCYVSLDAELRKQLGFYLSWKEKVEASEQYLVAATSKPGGPNSSVTIGELIFNLAHVFKVEDEIVWDDLAFALECQRSLFPFQVSGFEWNYLQDGAKEVLRSRYNRFIGIFPNAVLWPETKAILEQKRKCHEVFLQCVEAAELIHGMRIGE